MHSDIASKSKIIKYIPKSNKDSLITFMTNLAKIPNAKLDVNANRSISALKVSKNSFYESEIDKAISDMKNDSSIQKLFSDFVTRGTKPKTDLIKQSFVNDIMAKNKKDFAKDVQIKLDFMNKKIDLKGKCGYEIGSGGYISYFEKRIFGDKALKHLKGGDYEKVILNSANEIAGKIHEDVKKGLEKNDYIYKSEADNLSTALHQLKAVGISTHRNILDKLGKLSYDRYSANLIALSSADDEIQQDIMKEFNVSKGEAYDRKLLEISGQMPTKEAHYARNIHNNTDIKTTKMGLNYWFLVPQFGAACHQFSVENENNKWFEKKKENTKWTYKNQELVFDNKGNLVTDPRDMGTYNFAPWSLSSKDHYIVDVLPWIIWGNSSDDTTTVSQRINAYR